MAFKQLISDLDIKSILVFDTQGLLIYTSEQFYDFVHEPELFAVELLDYINSMRSIPIFSPSHFVLKLEDRYIFVKKYEDFYVTLISDSRKIVKAQYNFIKVYHRVIKALL